ncbi:PREDICTED: probable disease resistance protein At1g61180 isoform X2 [Camelina sativa]|uniref:Probable disease resistance protein At1g61180 isoform X2 n=1 Tax=Camelina sativa TaxID=90675 RepID=A0ABM0TRE5_CAMSA|nr:PREDICTED: probable disease resistance protein At1g61180 isoform X2 [Camelina sativa]
MGNCVSFQLSVDGQMLNTISTFLCGEGYIRNLNKNLESLQKEMEDLRASKVVVQNKVMREEETRHQQRREDVQVWLDRVSSIDIECKDVLSISPVELQKLCLCGFCSKSVCSSYKYGKRVFLLLEDVKNLRSEGKFDEVAQPPPRSEVEERPTQPTVGQEEMLEKAWNRLMEDGVGIMGLHGMGGVGKTTLFKKIHNKFTEIAGTFDVVIWIVVSQGAKISKLQEDIADKLHLCSDEWKNKNESDKAADIHRVLKGKRYVLMLDDIWEKVDLQALGVPFPTRENKCKVVFTTRSKEVCGRMGDHEPMEIKCLKPGEAWELFKNKLGDYTLRGDPRIVELAEKIAEECRGLPLALSIIGETMASQTMVQEWEYALHVLTTSAAEFDDMENKILPILKYSYDSLVDENIKSCFLYCALFPEDYEINKEKLIDYWICEGFIGDYHGIKITRNKGYTMLGTLIRANLLTEVGTRFVGMHDVVREMALWIASDFGKQKENFVVRAGVGLREVPEVKDWGAVKRMSLMKNDIKEIPFRSKCSELTTLFLQRNIHLKNLSGEFIQSMEKLVVLDLSGNGNIIKLPEQISKLASLQYLDLSLTSIEQLPVCLQELKKLNHLDLTNTWELCSVSGISKLLNLRVLKLRGSKVHGDVSLVKELQLLEHSSHVVEIYTDIKCRESETDSSHLSNPKIPCFTNISELIISNCHSIKDLTWLLFAPNLAYLAISYSRGVEEIINKEKATDLTGITITPFLKLERLELFILPKLESIYWSSLPFPVLNGIAIRDCPKLRKLPLNATSAPRLERFKIITDPEDPEHGNDIEWEDEDTKNRFLPSIRRV